MKRTPFRAKPPKAKFTEKTQALFFDYHPVTTCWVCDWFHADCLHHIFRRVSNSPFNAAPMSNFTCHINRDEKDGQHLTHLTTENQQAYLKHTIHYLSEMGYEPTEADKAFIEKYADEENRALFLEAFRF